MANPLTFLELVNTAIDEAKVTTDPLTSSNFANPPRTVMYNRFKRWVNMAYRELLMKRKEWHFRTERAVVNVRPRLHLAGLDYIPSVGDVLKGATSGVEFTVKDVHAYEDVERDSTVEYTVSVEFNSAYQPASLILKESINRVSPLAQDNVGYLKGWGLYDLSDEVTSLESILPDTLKLHVENGPNPVYLVSKELWRSDFEDRSVAVGQPTYITETSQGTYNLFPHPDKEYTLSFDFVRSIPDLSAYNDVPEGLPAEYHPYLIWRAVQEFADFDNQASMFSRARKHVDDYLMWLDRDEKQVPTVGVSKFRV